MPGVFTFTGRPTRGTKRKASSAVERFVAASKRIRASPRGRSTAALNARTGGFLGIEKKFYDTSLIGAALTAPNGAEGGEHNPSATICLNSVVQGDGETQRDGRQMVMKSITVKGQIVVPAQINQTASEVATSVFIALVQDTQTNGALLNSEDVFSNKAANAQTATSLFRNLQRVKRFKVLKTLLINLQQPATVYDGTNIEQGGYQMPFSMFKALPNVKVNFSGTTETIANIVDNSLSLIAYCSNTATAPTINYNARLRFMG